MMTPSIGPDAVEAESERSKMISDGAVKICAQYLIFSALQAVREISAVKYTKVGLSTPR